MSNRIGALSKILSFLRTGRTGSAETEASVDDPFSAGLFRPSRRAYPRIRFPRGTGAGELPSVFLEGGRLEIANLSLGGGAFTPGLGSRLAVPVEKDVARLVFRWADPAAEVAQDCVFHGIREGAWAFQFISIDPALSARLTRLMEPGIEGTKIVCINPDYFREGESLLEWYRSPVGTEIVIRGENVDGVTQADAYLQDRAILWTPAAGVQTARLVAQKGVNPSSGMREFSDWPYFVDIDEDPDLELVSKFLLVSQNVPQAGPALKALLRILATHLRQASISVVRGA